MENSTKIFLEKETKWDGTCIFMVMIKYATGSYECVAIKHDQQEAEEIYKKTIDRFSKPTKEILASIQIPN